MADIPYYLKRVNNRTASPIEASVGAYYYVFTKDLSTSVYRSASAIIELPDSGDVNVYGTDGYKRNAYISMGIRGYWTNNKGSFYGGLDLGMVCENNLVWHPAYYDATDRIGHGNDPDEASYTEFTTDSQTKNVKLTIPPLPSTSVQMQVDYLNASGVLLNGKTRTYVINRITTARTWKQYYRFGSLVPCTTGHDNRQDSTYLVGAKFTQARLNTSSGYVTWGIEPSNTQSPVELAFTYGHPKCQVTTINSDGEVFNIDHWA